MNSVVKKLASRFLDLDSQPEAHLAFFTESMVRRTLYFSRLMDKVSSVDGAIVECGVGQGRGLALLCSLASSAKKERQIWGFDSFAGFPKLSSEDQATAQFEAGLAEYKKFNEKYVYQTLQEFGLSRSSIDRHICFAKGFIPDSLALYDGNPVALLHLDLDIYAPYKAALDYFWDKMAPGGIVAFDEYNKPLDIAKWPGAVRAINEFLDSKNLRSDLQKDFNSGGVFIIKGEK